MCIGMGTSVERASAKSEFFTRGDNVPGDQGGLYGLSDGMGALNALTIGRLVMKMKTYR
jgi:hypothetical protein